MAVFIQKCPHCNCELQMQEEWSGMEVNCTFCQNKIIVAQPFFQTSPAVSPVAQYGQPQAANEKPCPFCGGLIKEQAVFCKHCQTNLNQAPAPQEQSFIFICPECETVAELPESLKNKEYECSRCCETSIAKETVERNCPSCGEKIKIKAIVCKHCKQKIKPITPAVKKENKNVLHASMSPVNRNGNDGFQKVAEKTIPVESQFSSPAYQNDYYVEPEKSKASLVLGIINCLAWILPIAGIPIGIIGLVLGCKKRYKAGIILNAITLTAAVTNSVLGAILMSGGF